MQKSVSKRIRFTKNGKMVRRLMGVDHFRVRRNQKNIKRSRKTLSVNYPMKKLVNY